ncbi:four helix bundle protein [Ulvibacter litoralis]|uniref:Four helix bundle protein n=1 Tax=Ulvibacter litoralis TaxID=227084 RepID=A0A1G7CPG4_9FLAO|nr:four helix bundle protein [Ulvibacter litoralis]SDE41103.1 four helix bundle protein [Ulvibacter litoralis]
MNHKDMDVWKKSMDLVEAIYKISAQFPKEEIYGLTSQIRRSAVSVPSNVAEGAARKSDKEFIQFISIALGSLSEVETQYYLSVRLGFIQESETLKNQLNSVGKLLLGTRNYLQKK